jgi:hypothetical protein
MCDAECPEVNSNIQEWTTSRPESCVPHCDISMEANYLKELQ